MSRGPSDPLLPRNSGEREPDRIAELEQWDREIVWHAFTQMAEYQPLLIERAVGCELIDAAGRRYLDGASSLWCNLHGHRHSRIDAAIREQLDKVAHVTSLGLSNSTTIRLARRLTQLAPSGLNHVFFSDNGATAVEVALKMAFQYWRQCSEPQPERRKFLAFANAYHGDTIGSVSLGGVERFHAMFRPLLFDVIRVEAPDSYRLPKGIAPGDALPYYLGRFEQALRQHHRSLAAVVIEPLVQAAAGMLMHPPGFLRGVRELTRQFGVPLIADEVAVGFGRTGTLFACEQEQVAPDFLCLAKGLSAGYLPVAATLTSTAIWDAFLGSYADSRSFFHGHTYGGNPLGCAAALANLELFDEEQTLAGLPPKIALLRQHGRRLAELPIVGDVRQCGMIAAVELVRDRRLQQPFPWVERRGQAVCDLALRQGVWLRPLGNVVVIMPPLAISLEQLDKICTVVYDAISRLSGDVQDGR